MIKEKGKTKKCCICGKKIHYVFFTDYIAIYGTDLIHCAEHTNTEQAKQLAEIDKFNRNLKQLSNKVGVESYE